jgi:16S rRNA processing protein RimM
VDERTSEDRNRERIVILGRIGGAFGVAGWVKIQSYTDPPGNLLKYPLWLVRGAARSEWKAIRRLQGREVLQGIQAQLEGVGSREEAAELRGADIGVRRSELPALPPGEFYWDDLIGLDAQSVEGERLGKIVEILDTPAHPLLRIAGASKAEECLVPLVPERIKAVDIGAGCATVDWQRRWLLDE